MAGSIDKARGLCNIFKVPNKPSSTDLISIPAYVESLADKLPGFFSSIEVWENSDVVTRELVKVKFPQRYLQVLSLLSEVMMTPIYMRNILENEDIEPKQQLIIIGQTPEVMFVNYMARYLEETDEALRFALPKPEGINAREFHATVTRKFFAPFLKTLPSLTILSKSYTDPKTRKIKRSKVINYLNKIYTFDKSIKGIKKFKHKRIL